MRPADWPTWAASLVTACVLSGLVILTLNTAELIQDPSWIAHPAYTLSMGTLTALIATVAVVCVHVLSRRDRARFERRVVAAIAASQPTQPIPAIRVVGRPVGPSAGRVPAADVLDSAVLRQIEPEMRGWLTRRLDDPPRGEVN